MGGLSRVSMRSWHQQLLNLGPRVYQSVIVCSVIIYYWNSHELINIDPGIFWYQKYAKIPRNLISGVLIVGGTGPDTVDKYSYTRRAGFWVGHISNRNIQRHISSVRWKCTMLGERGSVLSNMISIHSILGKTSPHQDTNNMANKMGHLNIAFYCVFIA